MIKHQWRFFPLSFHRDFIVSFVILHSTRAAAGRSDNSDTLQTFAVLGTTKETLRGSVVFIDPGDPTRGMIPAPLHLLMNDS